MYFFNIKIFARFVYQTLFQREGARFQLSPQRWLLAALFFGGFILFETLTWLCLLLDEVFFPSYRKTPGVEDSVFIIGNPRSGTTFLQRLLARDRKNFTSMKTWEILFAPSIIQRRLVQLLNRIDRALGQSVGKLLRQLEEVWKQKNQLHRISITAPEEDQYLFVHTWSTLSVWVFAGMIEEVDRYLYFDQEMPPAHKKRIMAFYKGCIKRHLFVNRSGRHSRVLYLSKNPSASPQIDSLLKHFPRARFIYLVRNPLEMIPSYISMLDFTWEVGGQLEEEYGGRDFVLEMARHWYTYPLKRLQQAPSDQYQVVNFDDLVSSPESTIRNLYQRFGLQVDQHFGEVLRQEEKQAEDYQSSHQYSLQEMGLRKKDILVEFQDVFDHFQLYPD